MKLVQGPIPHDNKTGDEEFLQKYFFESDGMKDAISHLKRNFQIKQEIVGMSGMIL